MGLNREGVLMKGLLKGRAVLFLEVFSSWIVFNINTNK